MVLGVPVALSPSAMSFDSSIPPTAILLFVTSVPAVAPPVNPYPIPPSRRRNQGLDLGWQVIEILTKDRTCFGENSHDIDPEFLGSTLGWDRSVTVIEEKRHDGFK